MRIFLAGATGALGRPLTRELVRRGHDVDGMARTPEEALALGMLGARAHFADLFDVEAVATAAEGADVVVHAAAALPTKLRPTSADWEAKDRLRTEGTRALVEAARRAGAARFVQQSVAWVARPDDGAPFDEHAPPNPDERTASALEGERIAQESGLEAVVLRCGWLYGPQAKHTRLVGEALLAGHLPVVGHADAPLAFLHTEDAARAFADAVEEADGGLYHVVDDEPASMTDFLGTLARHLGAAPPARVAPWLARLRMAQAEIDLVTKPARTNHDRFTAATGWRPEFRTVREGLRDVVDAWREEGYLMAAGRSTSGSLRPPSA